MGQARGLRGVAAALAPGHGAGPAGASRGAVRDGTACPGCPPEQAARPFGRSIAIAWRNEARTVKTVLAAMHLIGQAGTVHVLAGVREGVPAPRLPDILEEHNMAAQLHVLPITGQDLFG